MQSCKKSEKSNDIAANLSAVSMPTTGPTTGKLIKEKAGGNVALGLKKYNMQKKLSIATYGDNHYVPVAELTLAEYYKKKIIEGDAINLLRATISASGIKKPLIVNTYTGREGVIIDGAERYRIAKELNLYELPVWLVEVPEDREKILHYEYSVKGREYSIDELLEVLKKPYSDYFNGVVDMKSTIPDNVLREAKTEQDNAKNNPKARQQPFTLRMGEHYQYLDRLKSLTEAESINEAVVHLIISFVDNSAVEE